MNPAACLHACRLVVLEAALAAASLRQDEVMRVSVTAEQALAQLASDTKGGWVAQFVEAVFEDFLLNSVDGACFVLRSLPRRRPIEPHRGQIAAAGTVEELTLVLAKSLFSELLLRKTVESLEQHVRYQPV